MKCQQCQHETLIFSNGEQIHYLPTSYGGAYKKNECVVCGCKNIQD